MGLSAQGSGRQHDEQLQQDLFASLVIPLSVRAPSFDFVQWRRWLVPVLLRSLFFFDYLAHSARPGLGSWSASGPFAHGLGGDCPYLVAGKDGVSPANPLVLEG